MTLIDDSRMERPLSRHIKKVLESMFVAYSKLIVKSEFSEGFSGSRVFLVRPFRQDGRPELPSVVKVDDFDRIHKEWRAYQDCIHNRLSSVAKISDTPVYPPGSQNGGLRYPLAGDGAFDVVSLQAYCQQASIDDISYVLQERLFKSLEKLWEQKKVQSELHLQPAYDSFLHSNLLLEYADVSTDATTSWLHPKTIQRQTQPFAVGDIIQLSGFQVMRVLRKSQTIVLDIPPHLPSAYRLQFQSVPDIAAYEVGQIIHRPLTGQVKQTRVGALQEVAKEILGSDADLTAASLPLLNKHTLPNPLVALPKLLNQSFDAYTACIHADLHLGNVLVEPKSGNIHLIDFVNAREDHVLRDFLNLELAVVNQLLPPVLSGSDFPPEQIVSFYERLHCALRHPGQIAPPTRLERPFAMLRIIREAAKRYLFKQDEWREYYYGLIIYLLGSLRYSNLDNILGAKETAFWGAATVLKLLEGEVMCDGFLNGRDTETSSYPSSPRKGKSGKIDDVKEKQSGIPSAINTQLRVALLDCGSFSTERELKAIFVDERLHPWRYQLPEADNPTGRVESLIDFLHNQHNASQENALVLLLRVLSERLDLRDACHQRLADLADELEDVVSAGMNAAADVDRPVPQLLGNIPPQPPLVIGRERDIQYLKNRIGVGEAEKSPLTVVRGWPGVGKTTTVITLVHQPGIVEAFPDGVLWAALGENPNPFSELAAWGRALGVDDIGRLPTLEEAMVRLTAVLRNKQMLLIIDDVWETEHGLPFKIAGEKCATVFTTRFQDVARALADIPDDQIYKLPVLTDEKALELLQTLTPKTVEDHLKDSLILVQDLEGLPLAIQVAGRLLNEEQGMGWDVADLIADLREGAKLLAATAPADRADIVNQTTPTVAALLKKSTDTLSEENQIYFAFLGAFAPKPATFDLLAMAAVWLVDDAKPPVRILVNRGLLEPVAERYQMHALLVTHAKSLLTDEEE